MKVMIDTNIFISAALFPDGLTAKALYKAMNTPYTPVTCDYVVDELVRKFEEKFPHKTTELKAFLFSLVQTIEIVQTPTVELGAEQKIRDPKDRPILRAALNAGSDILLTGDKDFLEAAIDDPRIISVHDFLLQ